MPSPFQTTRRVEFCETDAAGIAHFSAFFQYMEQAEHALLRSLGTSVMLPTPDGKISWPRVAARCDYTGPARFEDLLDIAVSVTRLGKSSVTYGFAFTHQGRAVATGELTAVCCRFVGQEKPQPLPIPADLAARLQAYCG